MATESRKNHVGIPTYHNDCMGSDLVSLCAWAQSWRLPDHKATNVSFCKRMIMELGVLSPLMCSTNVVQAVLSLARTSESVRFQNPYPVEQPLTPCSGAFGMMLVRNQWRVEGSPPYKIKMTRGPATQSLDVRAT
eukprot:4568711-Amphidinium_carterae.1